MSSPTPSRSNPTLSPKLALINQSREVLRGKHTLSAEELMNLCLDLENYDQFAYATEILLTKIRMDEEAGQPVTLKDYQTLAKYIYKDNSLPSSFKFSKALQEIGSHADLATTDRSETLGLTGAIYKRRWQFDHQFKNLILSSYYYRRGYENWKAYIAAGLSGSTDARNDDGYTAINYAYINELMGIDKLEEHGSTTGLTDGIINKLKAAATVRREIVEQFTDPGTSAALVFKKASYPSWVVATVAEACFGLHRYTEAKQLINQYIQLPDLKPWEVRTFSQQIFSIAYLKLFQFRFLEKNKETARLDELKVLCEKMDVTKMKECLAIFAGAPSGSVLPEIKRGGKLGLALSGGGFRASLFHIGVLAALAEKDELRHVQVISCVSGGSIIGAYYYLKLKRLLETKKDDDITREDYILLIQQIETEFAGGVQKNLRMRVFSNMWSNLKMLRVKKYSRTHRMGELYEKHLFRKVWENDSSYQPLPKENNGTIFMTDLYINPPDNNGHFNMAADNWMRKNKVPQLVLNATSVNTGHNWQFTASWMGEPPGNIQTDIDVKPRLRRMYYAEAPDQFKKFKLGYAVGASSCVPVMFHPMPLHGLYPDIDLQLIDGGLHDNQGIAALIEQECKNMIISDASGQLPTSIEASDNEAATFYRADNILQERLRELQFLDIQERYYTTQLNTLVKVHLKSDLQSNPVSWKFCTDPPRSIVYANQANQQTDLTKYGILRDVQSMLSEIRTDLDSFNEVETKALMYCGYAQIHYEYKAQDKQAPRPQEDLWQFCAVKDFVTLPEYAATISKPLSTGRKLAFKVVYLSMPLRVLLVALGIGAAAGLLYLGIQFWTATLVTITVKVVVYAFIGFLLGLVSKLVAALFSYKTMLRKYAGLIALLVLAFLFCNFYLWLFNPLYNSAGKLDKRKN